MTTPPLTPHELAATRRAVAPSGDLTAADVAAMVRQIRAGKPANAVPLALTRAALDSLSDAAPGRGMKHNQQEAT